MAESVEDAFMREDAIGERQFPDRFRCSIEHSSPRFPLEWPSFYAANCSSHQTAHVKRADRPMQTFEVKLAERFELGELFNRDLDPAID